ncbi:hypothetical protein B0H11DRAFT_2279562, partial [Mycena galericulata]
MKCIALPVLLSSPLLVTARPSPDSAVTVLAVPEYEGFGGIDSIVPIGTAAAGDVTTYELIRTTDGGETDAETATLIESSGGYNLTWAPVLTELGGNSFTTDTLAEKCNFIGGGQASCGQARGGTFAPTTAAVEALITFGALSSPTSNTNPASTSAPSAGSGTGPVADPSRTMGVASSAAPASTSNKSNTGDVQYETGYGARALILSIVAALLVVC